MYTEVECPYCGHIRKNVYIEDATQEEIKTSQCSKCNKNFEYQVTINITTESFKEEV